MSSTPRIESVDAGVGVEARATIYRLLSQVFTYPSDQNWKLLSRIFVPLITEAADDIALDIAAELEQIEVVSRGVGPNVQRMRRRFLPVKVDLDSVAGAIGLLQANWPAVQAQWRQGEERKHLVLRR